MRLNFKLKGYFFVPISMDRYPVRKENGRTTTLPLEVFTQRNFVADVIRLKLIFTPKNKKIAPPQTAAPTVEALSHMYAVKFPFVTMARPKIDPKSTLSRGPIPKPHYLPHPWTRPTYDAKRLKRHPDPIRRFSTMHWTDRPTDRPTDRSSTGKFYDYSPLRL